MHVNLAEVQHVVNALPPVDVNGGKNSDVWTMGLDHHVSILIQKGAGAGQPTVTVTKCDDFTPSNETAIPFAVYKEETNAGDTLGTREAVAAAGFQMSANENVMYVIEVDAMELDSAKAKMRVKFSNPGASAICSVAAILSGSRYAGDQGATRIA